MDKDKVLNLFIKAEKKLEASFQQLPLASSDEQSLGLVQIQQTSYFLEKINGLLFHKIVKDCKLSLDKDRKNYNQLQLVQNCQVSHKGIEFTFESEQHYAPLLKIETIINNMKIASSQFSGKYVQIGYLLRPENYLDLCLIAYFKELENA